MIRKMWGSSPYGSQPDLRLLAPPHPRLWRDFQLNPAMHFASLNLPQGMGEPFSSRLPHPRMCQVAIFFSPVNSGLVPSEVEGWWSADVLQSYLHIGFLAHLSHPFFHLLIGLFATRHIFYDVPIIFQS